MRLTSLLALLALAAPAVANNSTTTGPGAPIPAAGSGGGSTYPALPPTPGESSAVVAADITSVTSIEVQGLTHTWIGDLQMVLEDPNGVGHLVFLRPGYLNTGAAGNSGDFNGTYLFVESGGSDLPTTSTTSTSPPPGTYNQTFSSGGVTWVSGDGNVFNTPLSSISGPAGTWKLKFYDWAGGDTGAFTGWTLNYRSNAGPGTATCFGDGSASPCGCGNESPAGSGGGCLHGAGGGTFFATLSASGAADTTADTLVLTSTDTTDQPGLFFQGNNSIGGGVGATFGDGIRCCGQNVVRLQIVDPANTGNGVATASSTVTISATGPANTVNPGDTKCYQHWFRNPGSSLCGSNFNLSNSVIVTWS